MPMISVCIQIINADDFGLHPLINKGIIEGHQKGMITSTSIMPGAPYFKEAANLAAQNPELGIGIHLTLVGGVAPVLKKGVNSLLTSQGVFAEDYTVFAKKWYTGSIKRSELESPELNPHISTAISICMCCRALPVWLYAYAENTEYAK